MIFDDLENFKQKLKLSEDKDSTVRQYECYIKQFITYANISVASEITKDILIGYKEYMKICFKVNTINIKIIVINSFLTYLHFDADYKLEQLTKQQQTTLENVLTNTDYDRLLRMADKKGKTRIKLIMKVLAETGIRISELKYITVESAKKGISKFDSKGTVERKAFINKKLQKELLKYCAENNITTGMIFVSRNGNPLDAAYIYREIQYIAGQARIKKSKAHPHSFRHLFAKNYLKVPGHNIEDLKNILGHKRLSTTEIYLLKTEQELKNTLER